MANSLVFWLLAVSQQNIRLREWGRSSGCHRDVSLEFCHHRIVFHHYPGPAPPRPNQPPYTSTAALNGAQRCGISALDMECLYVLHRCMSSNSHGILIALPPSIGGGSTDARQADIMGLTCRRRLHRLLRDIRRISGHIVQITAYEEARGELRYSIYLADHAANLQLKVDASALEQVLPDTSITTGEREALTSEDADRLLIPITDRLAISPSLTTVTTMSTGPAAQRRHTTLTSHGFILKVRRKVCAAWIQRHCDQNYE